MNSSVVWALLDDKQRLTETAAYENAMVAPSARGKPSDSRSDRA